MSDPSFLDRYKVLLISDDVLSKADDLDLVILPLYSESDAKYYYNTITGFCKMQEYQYFWKTMKLLRTQIFLLSKRCDPYKEGILFPRHSLIFPASLLDPIRSCMSPRFPNVRFTNSDGTKSYIIQLADLTTWGNATYECNGAVFAKYNANTVPAPVPEIINGMITHWRTGDYLPQYMTDSTFLLDEAQFSVTNREVKKSEYHTMNETDLSLSSVQDVHYHVIITVNKLQLEDSVLKESYGVACIGSFCLESSKIVELNKIVKMSDGVYMVTLSPTEQSNLDNMRVFLTTNSIKLLQTFSVPSEQSDQLSNNRNGGRDNSNIEVLDSVELNGSLYHVSIVAGPNTPGSILPSKQVDLKIALCTSESIKPLPIKDYVVQDSIETFQSSSTIDILKYGYNHFLTPTYGAQLLRLPAKCFSGADVCATPHHIRLAVHIIILIVLILISFIIVPAYIIGKLVIIRRLKFAAQKRETTTGMLLHHNIVKTPKAALKKVVRESQKMYASHLDQKRASLKSAMSGTGSLGLKDVAAILDVFPLDCQ